MLDSFSRRGFLGFAPALSFTALAGQIVPAAAPQAAVPTTGFPSQELDTVKEMVMVAHGNLARVKELVSARPALARAGWDWGFGDWETAIDAASHVGNRPIAEYLITNGARPTIYTAAMMGQLTIVKEWIAAYPGVQRNRGPHGITLFAHAKYGGAPAAEVLKYLESLGDADPHYPDLPMTDDDHAAIGGDYAFGPGPTELLRVARNKAGAATIQRPGNFERGLFHHGALVFNPSGAEAVRIRFEVTAARAGTLVVDDGIVVTRALRVGE